MIKVSVMYPNNAGSKFDMEYYCNRHLPMVQEMLGAALKSVSAEQGIGGGSPDAPATYVAMGHMEFDSVETFRAAFGPHARDIMADIPNYTDIEPVIQVSEIKI